jgi:hypothetical protein
MGGCKLPPSSDAAERAAIEYAKTRFREWRRPIPDLSEVRLAARALLAKLPPLERLADYSDGETMHLMALLQAQPPHVEKLAIFSELQQLRATLQRIDAATVPSTAHLRDDEAASWIATAADAWVDFTGKLPSSGDRSAFLRALLAYGDADMPKVNRDMLRTVLPHWRARRG